MKFYKNTADDLHCFQAALRMVLSVYFPKKKFASTYIDKITGFSKEKYTWDTKGYLWLVKKGFELVRVSDFNYNRFSKEGEKYLKWFWRSDVYEKQKEMSDFKKEQRISKKLQEVSKIFSRKATVRDIEIFFNKGYTVIAYVNPRAIDGKRGYGNHSVVIVDELPKHIVFHDPGIPPQRNRRVTKKVFQKALHEIVAVRQKNRGQ